MARVPQPPPPAAQPKSALQTLMELEAVILETLDATRVLQIVYEDARAQVVREGARGRIVLDLTEDQDAALAYAMFRAGHLAWRAKEQHERLFEEARS